MDCIQAQSIISEALDRSPVDAALLEEAKAHCRDCPQCGQYVRALNALRHASPPRAPSGLADRITATIRAEAAAQQQASADVAGSAAAAAVLAGTLGAAEAGARVEGAGAAADAPSVAAVDVTETAGRREDASLDSVPRDVAPAHAASTDSARLSVGRGPVDRRRLVAWGSAAAVLLVVLGVTGALGIMQLVGDDGGTRTASEDAAMSAAPEAVAPKATADAGAGSGAGATSVAPPNQTGPSTTPNLYVVYDGYAYVLQGPATQSKSGLKDAGKVRMTFDATAPPVPRSVYTGGEADTVYIENDDGELQRFATVNRSYLGKVYRLQSARDHRVRRVAEPALGDPATRSRQQPRRFARLRAAWERCCRYLGLHPREYRSANRNSDRARSPR